MKVISELQLQQVVEKAPQRPVAIVDKTLYIYNLALSFARVNFPRPSSSRPSILTGLRVSLLTKTCVYPPTAATLSSPSSNTPTSYSTELFPKVFTRSARCRTEGNERGRKNVEWDEITRPIEDDLEGLWEQWVIR